MGSTHLVVAVSALSTGLISMQDAITVATKTIGGSVVSSNCFTDKGGVAYYRITVVDSEGEVKDVNIGVRSGKVHQVIEHPSEMAPTAEVMKAGAGRKKIVQCIT